MILSLGFAVACVAAVALLWWRVPTLRTWPPALGLLIAVCTVVPPHQTVALGVGADDLLFLLGLVLLVPYVFRGGLPQLPYGRLLALGAGLLAAGTTISAFVNADSLPATLGLLVRGPGRVLLYVAAVLILIAQSPPERTRHVVARGLAAVGVLEAVVSLAAYVVGLPGGFGLEEARGNTSLLGEIPGRVNGTLELSPNFLGALFTLTIPVTLGIALDAIGPRNGHRPRLLWGLAVLSQLAALVLTYTRASMAVTLVACVALLALRGGLNLRGGRVFWLAGGAVVIAGLLVATPVLRRLVSDGTDRMALYASALKVFGAHPLAGVGPGEQAAFTAADPERFRATEFGIAGNNAHNTVLLAAAENGVLGLLGALLLNVAFVLVSVALIRRARKRWRGLAEPLGIGVAVLAFLIQGMTNNLFTVTLTATALVLLVGGCALPWLAAESRHALPPSKEI